jgi:DNA recombination protein RmuC
MFVPIEGLFAEVLRRPGLWDQLQRDSKVVVTGPTTILAILNSLQMGFRTIAIEKRSSEVWKLLGAVKNEFEKFGGLLDKTQKKLEEASNHISNASVRTRAIERHLRDVQEVPSEGVLEFPEDLSSIEGPDE